MKPYLSAFLTSLLLVSPIGAAFSSVRAQDVPSLEFEDSIEDDAGLARVARLTSFQGEVIFLRAETQDWAAVVANLPILAGDQMHSPAGARAEIQIGSGSFVRLLDDTTLSLAALDDNLTQLELSEGALIVRFRPQGSETFELDTPSCTIMLKEPGLYRVNVLGSTRSEVMVQEGKAEVSIEEGTLELRAGRRLTVDTAAPGTVEFTALGHADLFDSWSDQQDTTIDRVPSDLRPVSVVQVESNYNSFYGTSELASYGTWNYVDDYGDCWVPRVSTGWAPYRYGQWLWVPAAGWTWLSYERWGWAPYYFGRWVHLPRLGWAWVPGFRSGYATSYRSYYRWRPALVYFFHCPTSSGDYLGWVPLGPRDRWRRPDRYRSANTGHLRYPAERNRSHGTSILPISAFERPNGRSARPGAPDRDLSEALDRFARPGLPDRTLGGAAIAPVRSDGRSKPLIAPPSSDVLNRPVVTRRTPSNRQVAGRTQRERRVLVPNPGATAKRPSNEPNRRPAEPNASENAQRGNNKRGSNPATGIEAQPKLPAPRPKGRESTASEPRPNTDNRARDKAAGSPETSPETRKPTPAVPAPRGSKESGSMQERKPVRPSNQESARPLTPRSDSAGQSRSPNAAAKAKAPAAGSDAGSGPPPRAKAPEGRDAGKARPNSRPAPGNKKAGKP